MLILSMRGNSSAICRAFVLLTNRARPGTLKARVALSNTRAFKTGTCSYGKLCSMTTNCVYSLPLNYIGDLPTTPEENWNFSSSTCVTISPTSSPAMGFNPTTTIATTSDIQLYGFFSAGDVMIIFLLFCIVCIQLFSLLASALMGINIKKKWLAYGGGDVEVKEEI